MNNHSFYNCLFCKRCRSIHDEPMHDIYYMCGTTNRIISVSDEEEDKRFDKTPCSCFELDEEEVKRCIF